MDFEQEVEDKIIEEYSKYIVSILCIIIDYALEKIADIKHELRRLQEESQEMKSIQKKYQKRLKKDILSFQKDTLEESMDAIEDITKEIEIVQILREREMEKLRTYPNDTDLEKLKNLLQTPSVKISSKRVSAFYNIPFVDEELQDLFERYIKMRHEIIDEAEEEKRKEEKERRKQLEQTKKIIPKVIEVKAKTEHVIEPEEVVLEEYVEEQEEMTPLVQYFVSTLQELQNVDFILPLLPSVQEGKTYYKVKTQLLNALYREHEETKTLFCASKSIEDETYLEQLIKNQIQKIEALEDYFERVETMSPEELEPIQNDIIFCRSENGNEFAFHDLDDIPEEYLGTVAKLFQTLRENRINHSTQSSRKFTNNQGLKNVYELKGFKVRLLYQLLGDNKIAILMVHYKKSQNDRFTIEKMKTRISYCQRQVGIYQSHISNKTLSEEFVSKEQELADRFLQTIIERQRGQKQYQLESEA